MHAREYTRYPTGAPFNFKIDGMIGEQHLYLKDASQGGLSFNALACIKSGTHLDIRIPYADKAENIGATIEWCQPLGQCQCILGLSFNSLINQSAVDKISSFKYC